jgi:uncharacterized protein
MSTSFREKLYRWLESARRPEPHLGANPSEGRAKLMHIDETLDLQSRTDIEADFLHQLAETRAFRRLGDIRFLGALDYYLISSPNQHPQNSRYTRAQHSWGVTLLAQRYLREKTFSQKNRLTCLAAAMLHDIGHSAFSHTIEPAFTELFGINHHAVSEEIIRGADSEFDDVRATLTNFGVDPEEVVSVLTGEDKQFDEYFSGPINFDTIEGILRSRQYIKMETLGLSPWRVLRASQDRKDKQDEVTVDSFWLMKGEIYTLVIRSSFGAFLDQFFLEVFKTQRDHISPNDFYLSDGQMFRKFPILRKAFEHSFIESFSRQAFPDGLEVAYREFHVDKTKDFFARQDHARYQQSKRNRKFQVPKIGAA